MTNMGKQLQSHGLEDRVVEALGSSGLLRRRRSLSASGANLVLGALVGAGAIIGFQAAQESGEGAVAGRTYMLALYATSSYRPAANERSRAAEYARWAREHASGRAVITGGAELDPKSLVLGPRPTDQVLAGYFLVSAQSREDAVALARSSPHLRYGGTVVLQPAVH
jgi:hypothetical protein